VRTSDVEELVAVGKAIAPGFGGINLEDIAAPICFEVERRLQDELDVPVFHDVQHVTAIVSLAALFGAAEVVDRHGIVSPDRTDLNAEKRAIAETTNPRGAPR
jgi:malic enzyme